MDDLYEIFLQVTKVNQFTWVLIGCLSALSAYLVKEMTDSRMIAAIFLPIGIGCALIALYVFRDLGIIIMPEKDANTACVIVIGLMASIALVVVISRVLYSILGVLTPNIAEQRLREEEMDRRAQFGRQVG